MKRQRRISHQLRSSTTQPSVDPAVTSGPNVSLETWLVSRRLWVVLALVFASAGLRVAYFLQLNATPAIELHRWDQSDMNYYDGWGRRIASGDWLSSSVTVPMHDWQREVAERYLNAHPGTRARLLTQSASSASSDRAADVDRLLWTNWTGGHQFYEDPLYPYLVGLTYRLVGDDVRLVLVWQMTLGVLSNVLIWLLARRFFGDTVAVCAGALAVLCAPLMAYELILLRETTIVFAGLAIVWLTDWALFKKQGAWFALLGLSLGLACLLKSSFAVLAVGVSAGIVAQLRLQWRELRMPVAAMLAGLAVVLAPLMARNRALGVPPLALASSGGLTFMISNDISYRPENGFEIDAPRLATLFGEGAGGLLPSMAATLRPHTVATYTRLLWGKFDRAWYWFEMPNNENFYYTRLRAPVLAWLPVTFWLCSPLALVGLALALTFGSRTWPLYVLVLSSLIPLLVFYVLGRFRIVLVAAAIPFAALTIVQVLRWVGIREYRRVALAVSAVVMIGAWTGRPLADGPLIRAGDWLVPFTVRYKFDAQRALAARDPSAAATAYLEAFRYEPELKQLMAPPDTEALLALGKMHAQCAGFLRAATRIEEANAQVEKARLLLGSVLKLDASNSEANHLLADALFERQSLEEARVYYAKYLEREPDDVRAVTNYGLALAAAGKFDEAIAAFRHVVDINGSDGEAQRNLAHVLFDAGKVDEAAAHAERAVAIQPDDPAAHDVLGRAWALQGKMAAARDQFERSLRIDPAYAQAREDLQKISR